MSSPDLLSICGTAFIGVFILLAVLAVLMRLMLYIFPEKEASIDAAVIAAISTAVGMVYPGTKVTKVEEEK